MAVTRRVLSLLPVGLLLGGFVLAATTKDATKDGKTPIPVKFPGDKAPDVYADESGDADTALEAEIADEATQGSWADEGGIAPTADLADTGATALYTPSADTADYSPTGGPTNLADVADDVVDCAGGPFLGGSCGDLRHDGRLGVATNPSETLDVAGDARLSSLQVGGAGRVGISGSLPPSFAQLAVHGVLRATGFEHAHTTSINPADCHAWAPNMDENTFQYDEEGWVYIANFSPLDHALTAVNCRVNIPVGARVTGYDCQTTRFADGQYRYRPWNSQTSSDLSAAKTVEADEVHFIRVVGLYSSSDRFGGCQVQWRTSADIGS